MKTKLLLLFTLLFLSQTTWGARERNYIYILDCTKSMDGFNGAPKVWGPAKNFLRRNIERHTGESKVHIVPFQDKQALPEISFQAKDFNWKDVESALNDHVQKVTNTDIKAAWGRGNQMIDPKKNNYIFLVTDGKDPDPTTLHRIFKNWCGTAKNTRAFYVALTSNSNDAELKRIIDECESISWVSADSAIPDIGAFEPPCATISLEDIDQGKPAILSFSDEGSFPGSVECDDDYFSVKLDGNITGSTKLVIKPKKGNTISNLRNELDQEYTISLKLTSKKIDILNNEIDIKVLNKPVAILNLAKIAEDETGLPDAEYYPSFWGIFKASPIGQTSIDLNPEFNDIAINQNAFATFEVSGNDGFKKFNILYNGKECKGNKFVVSTKDAQSVLTIVFDPSAEDGKYYFTLKSTSPTGVKIINNQEISTRTPFSTSLRAKYDEVWNPWKTFFFWLGIAILACLLLWFIILRSQIYPPIKGVAKITILDPYFKTMTVRGAYKVIFSTEKTKQGFLARIFKGKIVSEVNPIWVSPLVFTSGKKGIRVNANSNYIIEPYANVLKKNSEYRIQINQTKTKVKISLN